MKITIAAASALLAVCLNSSVAVSQIRSDNSPATNVFPNNVYPNDPNEYLRRQPVRGSDAPGHHEPRVINGGPLAPPVADRDVFRAFLKTKQTGLLRLIPREVYRGARQTDVVKVRGDGAYYSFARLTHEYGYGSDIRLERDQLSAGFAGADYGFLTNLGDVPLEQITLTDPRTSVFANYRAAKTEAGARAEFYRFQHGVTVSGAVYRSSLPLEVSATYLLRSIIFGSSDVLVAFRVVRQDADGSAIILWKRLK